jgi:hypothetical protein
MWEKKVPQRIIEATEGLGDKVRKTPSVPYFGVHEHGKAAYAAKMKLLTLCELSVVFQNREEILKDSVYEDTEQGARIREPRIANVIGIVEYIFKKMRKFAPLPSYKVTKRYSQIKYHEVIK